VCGAQGGICKYIFFQSHSLLFLYKAKDLSARPHNNLRKHIYQMKIMAQNLTQEQEYEKTVTLHVFI
jgi:hypothetical protein